MKPFERLTATDIIQNLHINIAEKIFGSVIVFSDSSLTEKLLNRIVQFRAGQMIETYVPRTLVNFMAYEYFDERTERSAKRLLDLLTTDELYQLQSEMILNYENTKKHWKIYVVSDYIDMRDKLGKEKKQARILKMGVN
jgi:hypothetical protein